MYDALIIGGGPGGSATATYLARAGRKVLLLEKEKFPRFHIGESLLPYNRALFEEMGLLPALQAAGFPRKFGAQFHVGNGTTATKFVFGLGRFTREPEAIQVERAKFDHILLQHAAKTGAEIREGWAVTRFAADNGHVTLDARSPEGEAKQFQARFLIDASGRGNFTGNQEGIRVVHPKLKKLAVFGHFTGVKLDEGDRGGDTVIVRLANKWFWLIPISAEKTSVGCVMDADEFAAAKSSPAEVFQHWAKSSPVVSERMEHATLCGAMQTTSDFSYKNKRFAGHRLLRVGDAAGFMDPIFSAGVYLAMFSGKLAAQAVDESLKKNDDGARSFAAYEKRIRSAMRIYQEMVDHFYTTPFMELFLQPREKFSLPAAVNAVLAGELHGGWRLRWRLRLFFLLVRAQARWPLVTRITFD